MSAASPSSKGAVPSPDQLKQLEGLRSYIQGLGGRLEEGWTVQLKSRAAGSGHAAAEDPKPKSPNSHVDTYFINPKGKKFRSRLEVARSLGIAPEKKEKVSGASGSSKTAATTTAATGGKKAGSGGGPSNGPSGTVKPSHGPSGTVKPSNGLSGTAQKQITSFFQSGGANSKSSDPKPQTQGQKPPSVAAKPAAGPPPAPAPFVPLPIIAYIDDEKLPDVAPPPPEPLSLSPLLTPEDVNKLMQVHEMLDSMGTDLGMHKPIKGIPNQAKGLTSKEMSYQAPSLPDLAAIVTLTPPTSASTLPVDESACFQTLLQASDRIHCGLAMSLSGEVLESLGEWLTQERPELSLNKSTLVPNSNLGVFAWPEPRSWPESLARCLNGSVASQVLSFYERPQPTTKALPDLPARLNKLEAPDWCLQMVAGSSNGSHNPFSLLPPSASKTAAAALANIENAKSLAATERILKSFSQSSSLSSPSMIILGDDKEGQAKLDSDIKVGRELLSRLLSTSTRKAGTARTHLSFFASLPMHPPIHSSGTGSTVVERGARATDMHGISCRLSYGVYSLTGDALAAMAADVRSCCNLWRAMNSSGSGVQASNWELGDQVERTLDEFLDERERLKLPPSAPALTPVAEVKVKVETKADPAAEVKAEFEAEGRDLPGLAAPEDAMVIDHAVVAVKDEGGRDVHAIKDPSRPFLPISQGCRVCWGAEHPRLICQGCNDEYHLNCIEPSILSNEPPQGEWFCPSCNSKPDREIPPRATHRGFLTLLGAGGPELPDTSHTRRCMEGLEEMLGMVEALRTKEHSTNKGGLDSATWSPSDRVRLLHLLTELVAESSVKLSKAVGENAMEAKKEARKEIAEIRARAKEREEAAKVKAQASKPLGNFGPVPQGLSDKEKKKIAKLELVELKAAGQRECLGTDRKGNRYWWMGKIHNEEDGSLVDPGCIFVESPPPLLRRDAEQGSMTIEGCTWGVYPTVDKIEALLTYLDPKGKAEHLLTKQVQKVKTTMDKVVAAASKLAAAAAAAASAKAGQGEDEVIKVGDDGAPLSKVEAVACHPSSSSAPNPAIPKKLPAILMLSDHLQPPPLDPGSIGGAPDQPLNPPPSLVEELRQEILSIYHNALSSAPDSFHDFWGSEKRQAQWLSLTTHATKPRELSASLSLLEGMLAEVCLKPYYPLLWTSLHQNPDCIGTFAATFYRLKGLQGAIKKLTTLGLGARSRGQQSRGGGGGGGGGAVVGSSRRQLLAIASVEPMPSFCGSLNKFEQVEVGPRSRKVKQPVSYVSKHLGAEGDEEEEEEEEVLDDGDDDYKAPSSLDDEEDEEEEEEDSDYDDDDDEDSDAGRYRRSSRGGGSARGSGGGVTRGESRAERALRRDIGLPAGLSLDDVPKKKRGVVKASGAAKKGKASSSRGKKANKAKKRARSDDDEESDEDEISEDSSDFEGNRGRSRRGGKKQQVPARRETRGKKVSYAQDDDDDVEEEEDEDERPRRQSGFRGGRLLKKKVEEEEMIEGLEDEEGMVGDRPAAALGSKKRKHVLVDEDADEDSFLPPPPPPLRPSPLPPPPPPLRPSPAPPPPPPLQPSPPPAEKKARIIKTTAPIAAAPLPPVPVPAPPVAVKPKSNHKQIDYFDDL